MLTSAQCKAARALLDWSQGDLSERVSISAVSIRAFEKGGAMRESSLRLIRMTFEAAGVQFLQAGEVSEGVGAALRSPSQSESTET